MKATAQRDVVMVTVRMSADEADNLLENFEYLREQGVVFNGGTSMERLEYEIREAFGDV